MNGSLTEARLLVAVEHLSGLDPDLARIAATLGPPPLWAREPGFPTLVLIILEQQVSLASARAAFDRLRLAASPLTPASLLSLDDETLRAIGFSRQKARYCRLLAQALLEGELDLEELARQDDNTARTELLKRKGIGAWTTDIYLLMCLCRPDIWPVGDLALQVAVQEIKQLPTRPTPVEMEAIGAPWRPWRAVAARLLWHYYLNGRN
ncbi:MAG: hypothetical protein R3C14_23360 [Caldilineaceae bacterium]